MADETSQTPPDEPTAAHFDMPAVSAVAGALRSEVAGDVIGPYTLVREVGSGGFGSVWLAEQSRPVSRPVALKIIKLGMDTRQVIARFEAERQALAMMDHPHIAKVFDAGASSAGRPYFVMEFCAGQPVTAYCDGRRLTVRQRLALFLDVCSAVQHAHAKGVIHRDIKPSNVLVADVDARPVVKVIDFGIAKATSGRLADDRTSVTRERQFLGTPAYMSPEQAEGSQDVDTRTDVYSLGVLLYALLAGTTPFSTAELSSATDAEMQRIIREVDPPKPSTRISASGNTIEGLARQRNTEPGRLRTQVRGELDWIVMRAIEKDRARRYDTPGALADDVRRHLAGEPVLAVPPSRTYRLRKIVRRSRVAFAAGGAVAASLVAGIVAFAWQARVAGRQRDIAVAAQLAEAEQRRAADAQRDRAVIAEAAEKRRSDELRKVSDFQSRMLAQVDPAAAGARLAADVRARYDAALARSDMPVADRAARSAAFADEWVQVNATDAARALIDLTILRPADAAIDEQFGDQPVLAATLRQTLADRYMEIGLYDRAVALCARARDDRARLLGPDAPDTLASANNLGSSLVFQGRFADAEKILRDALGRCRRALGDRDPITLQCVSNLGACLKEQDRLAEAEQLVRPGLDAHRQVLGPDDPRTLDAMQILGSLLWRQGRYAEAESVLRDLLARSKRVHGEDAQPTTNTANLLSAVLQDAGKYDDAAPFAQSVVDRDRRMLGEDHPGTLTAMGNLAALFQSQGKIADAIALGRRVLAARRRTFGPNSVEALLTEGNLGSALMDANQLGEAEPVLKHVLDSAPKVFGPSHREVLRAANAYGVLLMREGNPTAAEPYWRRAYEGGVATLGPDHPDTLTWTNNLAVLLNQVGRNAEAEPLFRRAHSSFERSLGRDDYNTVASLGGLGMSLQAQGKLPEAETADREALDRWLRYDKGEGPNALTCMERLVTVLRAERKFDEALVFAQRSLAARTRPPNKPDVPSVMAASAVANLLDDLGRFPESESARRQALSFALAVLGPQSPDTLSAQVNLAATLVREAKYGEADPLLETALQALARSTNPDKELRVALARAARGALRLGQARYAEAEQDLLFAEPVMAKSPLVIRDRYLRTVANLAALYDAWPGHASQAAEWKAKLPPPR